MMEPVLNDFNIVSNVAGVHSCIMVFKIESMWYLHPFVIMGNGGGVGGNTYHDASRRRLNVRLHAVKLSLEKRRVHLNRLAPDAKESCFSI